MLSSKFIKATEAYATYEKPVHAPYVRKTFTLDARPEKASVTLTCTGFYRLWVNGTELTGSRLAPGITNPDSILFYDTYDVTAYLTEGKNCFALLLGNGMSDSIGGFIWDFDKALFRSAPKLALAFKADGATVFEADESFVCAPSPIYFDDLRSGEFYDATLEKDGWTSAAFDDSDWCAALHTEPARGKAVPNDTDPITVTKELKPIKIYEGRAVWQEEKYKRPDAAALAKTAFYQPEQGETGVVFEFAENAACVPKLKIRGRKGQKIILQASEYCAPDGTVSYEAIEGFYPWGFCQRDIYICKGEGVEEYVPSFTYHGARYFLVIGADKEQITDETVTMLVQNSALAERGSFSCSDPVANALQKAARASDLANFVYFPTDCPHREKNGWTGDAAMSAEHMIQNLTVERSWKQWLKMICAEQREDGAIPGIVPTAGWGYAWGNGPVWDQVLVELPYQAYIYRGDLELFRTTATAVMRYLNYVAGRRSEDGALRIGLGDWCHALRGGSNHVCPLEVSDTVTVIGMCRKASFLFDKCGMTAQKVFAETLGNELLGVVRERFIDYDTMTVRGSCQTAQAMGLYYDIFERGERAAAYSRLLELVHEADDHFDCGMVGVRVLFRTLAAHGDAELAYKLITRDTAPSYTIMTEKSGLVSLAETFLHHYDGGNFTSLNHHFMGDISGFFIRHLAGLCVNPDRDDAACVRVAPSFIAQLDGAKAYYDTVGGRVSVSWQRKDGEIELTVEKADGVHGEVALPKGYAFVRKTGMPDEVMVGRRLWALENAVYTVKKI